VQHDVQQNDLAQEGEKMADLLEQDDKKRKDRANG
jgi:hypothetical protein